MPTLPKLIFGATIHALPLLVIIVAAGFYSARRKSILGGLIAVGIFAIAVQKVWSMFAPLWLRTHTPAEYGRIVLPMAICSLVGWYLVSIALAVILMGPQRSSDNKRIDLTFQNAVLK